MRTGYQKMRLKKNLLQIQKNKNRIRILFDGQRYYILVYYPNIYQKMYPTIVQKLLLVKYALNELIRKAFCDAALQ